MTRKSAPVLLLAALGGLAVVLTGCVPVDGTYKARDRDPNAGGGSMYRAIDLQGSR